MFANPYKILNTQQYLLCFEAETWCKLKPQVLRLMSARLTGNVRELKRMTTVSSVPITDQDVRRCNLARSDSEALSLLALSFASSEEFLQKVQAGTKLDPELEPYRAAIMKGMYDERCVFAEVAVKLDPLIYLAYVFTLRHSGKIETKERHRLQTECDSAKNKLLALPADSLAKNEAHRILVGRLKSASES